MTLLSPVLLAISLSFGDQLVQKIPSVFSASAFMNGGRTEESCCLARSLALVGDRVVSVLTNL